MNLFFWLILTVANMINLCCSVYDYKHHTGLQQTNDLIWMVFYVVGIYFCIIQGNREIDKEEGNK